ncbi:calmodulin-binding protein 25-like [Salvia divinorum]|uniref:Calmodulin-binding protein 25-like n=1 Tax=Salvia divinorum TaxID=28513 RepID=A0ABD1HE62_SALDI
MASYDHLLAEQPWSYRPAFPDTWITDLFTMENETLTKALHTSIYGGESHGSAGMLQSIYSKAELTPVHTPTVSGMSENEALVSKQQRRRAVPIGGGRMAKRKSRPSKRAATTTFYNADPENFMWMVQEVTGAKIGGSSGGNASASAVSRPEPRRAADGFPTLDTSAAFMLDASASYAEAATDGGARATEHYLDSLCSFPTLESWEA